MQEKKARIALWRKHTLARTKRQRYFSISLRVLGVLSLLSLGFFSYRWGAWPSLLDWSVVLIPAGAGLAAWVFPVKQTTPFHRLWFSVGCIGLAILTFLQQRETRIAHQQEIARLATKDDVASTAQQIVLEFRKASTQTAPIVATAAQSQKRPAESGRRESDRSGGPDRKPDVVSDRSVEVARGIEEIKHMLGAQEGILTADQLVDLSLKMAPFASVANGWSISGGDLITSVLGNSGSNRLATAFIAALRAAGWKLPGSGMSLAVFSGQPEGIIFVLHSREDATLPIVKAFASVLKDSGVAFHGEIREDVPAGQFRLVVGSQNDSRIPVRYQVSETENLSASDKASASKK